MLRPGPDILIVTDPRFAGGTSAAVAEDCRAMLACGARIGLLFVTSRHLDGDCAGPSRPVRALLDLPGVSQVAPGSAVAVSAAFFHNPQAFQGPAPERARIHAERAVMVAHHAPFRGDGALEYDPLAIDRSVRRRFGTQILWAPISALSRRQLRSFAPLIRLTSEDWVNLFDPRRWTSSRPAFAGSRPTVGRHGRDDPLKWPATGAEVDATLPAADGWRVRAMGCPTAELVRLGAAVDRWDALAVNAEEPAAFLESLDVFSYFFHPRLVESFGRTVVEAVLMERPCVLDRRLEATFPGFGAFCAAAEARDALSRLREAPAASRAAAAATRARCLDLYGAASMQARLERLVRDAGVVSRAGDKAASALVASRKLVGHYRRAFAGAAP